LGAVNDFQREHIPALVLDLGVADRHSLEVMSGQRSNVESFKVRDASRERGREDWNLDVVFELCWVNEHRFHIGLQSLHRNPRDIEAFLLQFLVPEGAERLVFDDHDLFQVAAWRRPRPRVCSGRI
jgi:hypothetical protein